MNTKETGQKLVLLGILFLIVFTYPFITIANRVAVVAGFPVLYLYILAAWCIAIILVFLVAEGKQRKRNE